MTLATHRDVEAGYSDGNSPNQMARIHLMTDQAPGLLQTPQYIIEGIVLRRMHEKRIEGYTLEMAKEIADALTRPPSERPLAQMREALEHCRPLVQSFRYQGRQYARLLDEIDQALALTAERPEAAVAWRTLLMQIAQSAPLVQSLSGDAFKLRRALETFIEQAEAALAIQHEEPGRETMTSVSGELEMLAKDCEELALDAQNSRDEGLKRAHLSIAYRIRHAVKKLP